MKKHFLILPFLLVALVVSAEPIVRVVSTNAPDEAFTTDQAAFLAQKDTANGKKTMKAYLWKVCGDAYDAEHPRN